MTRWTKEMNTTHGLLRWIAVMSTLTLILAILHIITSGSL